MKRQGLQVSIKELVNLITLLNSEDIIDEKITMDRKFQINIINKTPEQSDTWEIEE